jgi:pyruvate/2-oxoglutarate/acetoin dehydrogenase E1 component
MRELTYAQAINESLIHNLEKDERVFLLGEDIGKYGGIFQVTAGLLDKFGPERVIDTPISESAFVGAAIGAAMTGMRPIVEIMFIKTAPKNPVLWTGMKGASAKGRKNVI